MTTFIDKWPTARKPHRCQDCGRAITPGERYRRTFAVDGGDVWTYIECEHCPAIVHLLDYADWTYTCDDFAEWEPTTIADLRLKVQWLKQWTRSDGTLYPVPVLR